MEFYDFKSSEQFFTYITPGTMAACILNNFVT